MSILISVPGVKYASGTPIQNRLLSLTLAAGNSHRNMSIKRIIHEGILKIENGKMRTAI
jgi:hypothetical protein